MELELAYIPEIVKCAVGMEKKVDGYGGMDFMMDSQFIDCSQNGLPPDQDVYDTALWSLIGAFSEWTVSIAQIQLTFPILPAVLVKQCQSRFNAFLVRKYRYQKQSDKQRFRMKEFLLLQKSSLRLQVVMIRQKLKNFTLRLEDFYAIMILRQKKIFRLTLHGAWITVIKLMPENVLYNNCLVIESIAYINTTPTLERYRSFEKELFSFEGSGFWIVQPFNPLARDLCTGFGKLTSGTVTQQ